MRRKVKYKKYDPILKALVSMTGSEDLFPEMCIPRMTARYWIKQGFETQDPILVGLTQALKELKIERDDLVRQISEQRTLLKLLHYVFKVLGFRLNYKKIEDSEIRSKILDAIGWAMETVPRDLCLEELELSLSRYKRWRREKRTCGFTGLKSCPKWVANQLTLSEVQTMRNLVTSKEFAHFPIRSLHYYAKREGILFCSYSTWTKYIDHFAWKRVRKVFPEKTKKIGIRAKKPNEIWHLDISYFIFPNKTKCFIQPIIDNYSRYVIAWQVLESYDGEKTAQLIQRAIQNLSKGKSIGKSLRLIVDGGGENKGAAVRKLEGLRHFRKQVAHFEISFSNSMVEALFRSLKHNYLFHQNIATPSALRKHVDFWFTDHNERIPHSSFNGETPLERFSQTWDKDCEIRILIRHEEAIKLRIKENQKIFCDECEVEDSSFS